MRSSKLIQILQVLNKHELNKLRDLVKSPYFNKSSQVVELLEWLVPHHPEFKQLTKQKLLAAVFGNSEAGEKKLRYLMSDLTQLAERFLMLQEFDGTRVQQTHLLLRAYHKKNLLQYAHAQINKGKQLLHDSPWRDDNYYFENFLIEKDNYEYIASKRNLAVRENLTTIISNLDYFYIIYKLKFSSELINHAEGWAGEYDPLMLNEIISHLKSAKSADVPAISIYYEILMMLTDTPSEPHYFKLKELLAKYSNSFPREEVNDMYIFARNFCAHKINSGETAYLQEIFELYRSLLDKEILLVNGYLSQWDYKNIVAVGLRIEAFDWVKEFIHNFKDKLKPESRENAYSYNLAYYFYYTGQLDKTIELLRDVEFSDVYYNLDCKMLLLKTYYELDEVGPLYSLMDAFYMYLRRNKLISDFQRKSYQNFLKMLKRINRLRPNDDQKKNAILSELENTHPMANVSWLKKKIEEGG